MTDSRRGFRTGRRLAGTAAVCAVMMLAPDARAQDARAARPNILFALADDWSWPHAGAYGDPVVRTPTFDRVAHDGILFTNAYCAAPSCTPSRGAILTGQEVPRLGPGANLWSHLPKEHAVYPDLLEAAGYVVGGTRKGWGPGNHEHGNRVRNPAGPWFSSFEAFMETVPDDQPFCFWFGSQDPHRPYEIGSGLASGMKIEDVIVPGFLPDVPVVRSDIMDYYVEVQRFDREVGEMLDLLRGLGRLDNTLIVITSDNGMPFPRAKATLYDGGTRMPMAIHWPGRIRGGRIVHDFVSFTDFAPTFLEAAGLTPPDAMTGRSLLGLLTGETDQHRDRVFFGRERHANVRRGDLSYPSRAVRTHAYLYIRNFRPDRWPAGDPEYYRVVGPFGDIDGSPTKDLLLDKRDEEPIQRFFELACAKRPAEELYDLRRDPDQVNNVAGQEAYADVQRRMRETLEAWQETTGDPRLTDDDDRWDRYPYFGRQRELPEDEDS